MIWSPRWNSLGLSRKFLWFLTLHVNMLLKGLHQKGKAAKKKKKKKTRLPANAHPVAEMQWRNSQDLAMESQMMHMGPSAYNPYWAGMLHGMEGFMPPFGGPVPPYMGYGPGPGPLDVPFGVFLQDPYGVPNMMMPHFPPPQREEFEARKADVRRKRELERRGERYGVVNMLLK